MPNDDHKLVVAARAGDDGAFETLINRHKALVFGTVWSALQDRDDAEDASQEAFVLAYRRIGDLLNPSRFSSWLYAIARNVAHKHLRKREMEGRWVREAAEASEAGPRHDVSRKGIADSDLRRTLSGLSPGDRAATTLHYLVGMGVNQIASALEIPQGTVKSRLHRSRRKLKTLLEGIEREKLMGGVEKEDYGREVVGGMRDVAHWTEALQGDGLEGLRCENPDRQGPESLAEVWTRNGDCIVGHDIRGGEQLFIGDDTWANYEFSALITPISGGNAQIFFRVSPDRKSWYLLDMMLGWKVLAIARVDPSRLIHLSSVNFPVEDGQEYDVQIAARGASLTTYIDGKLVNQVTDFSFSSGPIALNVWYSKTAYRDPRYRVMPA